MACYAGLQVPLFYDPLLSKLIVWGRDRAQAVARMRRALDEYTIVGVHTTLPFARWLMDHPRYQAGDFSTDFIAEEWPGASARRPVSAPAGEVLQLTPEQVAALAGALLMQEQEQEEQERRSQPPKAARGAAGAWQGAWRFLRKL